MRIFGLGMPELLVILGVVLLIFGPKNLPKLGSALGKTVKGLREGMGSAKQEIDDSSDEAADEGEETIVAAEEQPESAPATSAESGQKTVRRVVKKKAE